MENIKEAKFIITPFNVNCKDLLIKYNYDDLPSRVYLALINNSDVDIDDGESNYDLFFDIEQIRHEMEDYLCKSLKKSVSINRTNEEIEDALKKLRDWELIDVYFDDEYEGYWIEVYRPIQNSYLKFITY